MILKIEHGYVHLDKSHRYRFRLSGYTKKTCVECSNTIVCLEKED